ncbi:MAG: hypothetical protein JF630_08870 [Geodermatophilales bacterium]|nr:hypothetical protein [Geodermatophilales bacterium]
MLQEPPSSVRNATVGAAPAGPAPVGAPADLEQPAPAIEAPAIEAPAIDAPAIDAPAEPITETVAEPVTESLAEAVAAAGSERVVEDATEVAGVEEGELAPVLARTASDPAPMTMSLDATSVMPPLSLIPPLPGSRPRGLPPVPPSSRPAVPSPRPTAPAETPTTGAGTPAAEGAPDTRSLATVTRLPVVPLVATPETPEIPGLESGSGVAAEPVAAEPTSPAAPVVSPRTPSEVIGRLDALGLPGDLLGPAFADDVATHGTYAALTRALGLRLPKAPAVPDGAGEVLFVVGPGVETLRAARSLAASLRLDPERVQWATRGDLAGLAPESSRMTTVDTAIHRRHEASNALTLTIVAVDAPLRTDAYWMSQMLAIWSPDAVWAVLEATRKPEDLLAWLDGLSRVDALIVQDTDLSADPAAVLRRVAAPVALLDGVRATPHRWASLLCERLESTTE